jgi:YheC/D like ATP-grasp
VLPPVKKRIGILTYRGENGFLEPGFLRLLVKEGEKLGCEIFLFGPQDVHYPNRAINGFTPAATGWKSDRYAWPDIVIDRYRYYPVPRHSKYLAFRQKPWFRYANSRFANKFSVHQVLEQEPELHKWLPQTLAFSKAALSIMLAHHRVVYLKPTNGTGGRSILRIERKANGYELHGRTKQKKKIREKLPGFATLFQRLERWTKQEKQGSEQFFLQQGLELNLVPGHTVDARLLAQKDGTGTWRLTGMAVRMGTRHSSTSNLHSGGKAISAAAFLNKHFGWEMTQQIIQECREVALRTVARIEEHFGPMMEFGFDLGIDVNGNVWLIEMNPKPGREIFRQLGQKKLYLDAVRRPLEYALHLLEEDHEKTLSS